MAILTVNNISLSFGEESILEHVSFELQKGQRAGLVGVNGSGKTSLFKVLTGEHAPDSGSVTLSRDAVLGYMEERLPESDGAAETKDWLRSHIDEIEEISRRTVADAGTEYPVSAAVTTCWFPDKTYGDVTFPAGNYEALRIEIGEAKGHNWWCVLYPGLCFMDTTNAVVPDEGKQKLKNVLTEEEYSRITADSDFKIGWFFW